MMRRAIALAVFAALLAPAASSVAATAVWSTDAPVLGEDFDVDFEGLLTGISAVEVSMAGYGGGQHGYCQDMGGDDTYFWLAFQVTYDFENAVGSFHAPERTAYDETTGLELVYGAADWSFLNDGKAVMHISYDDNYAFNMIDCYPTGFEALTATSLVVTVTCDTVVPTETASWSGIKTLYR